jgi:RNA polymerase sigma factor (sigma-70 family)
VLTFQPHLEVVGRNLPNHQTMIAAKTTEQVGPHTTNDVSVVCLSGLDESDVRRRGRAQRTPDRRSGNRIDNDLILAHDRMTDVHRDSFDSSTGTPETVRAAAPTPIRRHRDCLPGWRTVSTVTEEEFREAFDLHHERIRRYLARRVARDHVDDLASETFTILWRRRHSTPTGENLLPWLTVTARNLLANHYRRNDRRRDTVERLNREPGIAHADPYDPTTGHDDLDRALAELGDTDREILLLDIWDGLTGQQIADTVGLSINAVHLRLSRTRQQLRDTLGTPGHGTNQENLKSPTENRASRHKENGARHD